MYPRWTNNSFISFQHKKMQSFLRNVLFILGFFWMLFSIITLFNSNLRAPRFPFLLPSLEWKKIDTKLLVIIHILSLACQVNKIYSSAATWGLHSRVKMQTISYGGRQMPCFVLVSMKSFVCQFIFVIFSDFFQLSIGTKNGKS